MPGRGAWIRSASAAVLLTLAIASLSLAHALPQTSEPAAGSDVAVAPTQVIITFGEAPIRSCPGSTSWTSTATRWQPVRRLPSQVTLPSSPSHSGRSLTASTRWPGALSPRSTDTSLRARSHSASGSAWAPPGLAGRLGVAGGFTPVACRGTSADGCCISDSSACLARLSWPWWSHGRCPRRRFHLSRSAGSSRRSGRPSSSARR